jgi:ATP-dependent RNA helicase RhlE
MKFTDLKLDSALQRGVADMGFEDPTPIQEKAIPPALSGCDVLGCAMTGSGKTAAFVLPILQRLLNRPGRGTRALVLTPTRELAAQIHEHLVAMARHTPLRAATVFGGVKPAPQERAIRAGVEVVIATPGRLLDHMRQPWARFERLEYLVLDEADRMLDMGFLPDVKRILSMLPGKRQTMLFSATMPRPIVKLSHDLLSDPVRLDVERRAAPATGVKQAVLPVPDKLKPRLLLEMIRTGEVETALVFTRTKHRANRLAEYLAHAGVPCDRIHGNRSQPQREAALAGFKTGKLRVLVATDIAARGIDVEALPHVVNFDVPAQPDDYIHRVGRTARAKATGDALTLASPAESGEIAAIERAVGRKLERRWLDGFDYKAQPKGRFEIPIGERIAAIRARKAEERARSRAKAELRAQRQADRGPAQPGHRAEAPARPNRSRRRHRRSRSTRAQA